MTRARECGNKQRHPSRADAEDHRFRLVRTLGVGHNRMMSYRCRHCGSWHIGHRRKRRR